MNWVKWYFLGLAVTAYTASASECFLVIMREEERRIENYMGYQPRPVWVMVAYSATLGAIVNAAFYAAYAVATVYFSIFRRRV